MVSVRGGFHVIGAPQRTVPWKRRGRRRLRGRRARFQPATRRGWRPRTYFQAEGEVWSFGAVVTLRRPIERETGRLAIESLVWVDDAGTIINPLLAEGQLHGGRSRRGWGR